MDELLPKFGEGVEWKPKGFRDFDLGDLSEALEGEKSEVSWEPAVEHIVIYDPLAYYVPFSKRKRGYGIRLLTVKMLRDWLRLNQLLLKSRIYFPWTLYRLYIVLHELAHHVVEEVVVSKGLDYLKTYSEEEEGLCEYTAFATLSGITNLNVKNYWWRWWLLSLKHGDWWFLECEDFLLFRDGMKSGFLDCFHEPLPIIAGLVNHVRRRRVNWKASQNMDLLLSILYAWWGRDSGCYRPVIRPNIWKLVGDKFERALGLHIVDGESDSVIVPTNIHPRRGVWRTIKADLRVEIP